jgi:hypothetical protein
MVKNRQRVSQYLYLSFFLLYVSASEQQCTLLCVSALSDDLNDSPLNEEEGGDSCVILLTFET